MTIQQAAEMLVSAWAAEKALYLSFDSPDYVGDIVAAFEEVLAAQQGPSNP